ncbi:MAG: hypothetical protein ACLR1V_15540 [Coprococcus sp.]
MWIRASSSEAWGQAGTGIEATAKTSAGTTTLVNSALPMVLGSGRTVADGTYYIESMKNNGYGLNVSGSSGASGANVVLWGEEQFKLHEVCIHLSEQWLL